LVQTYFYCNPASIWACMRVCSPPAVMPPPTLHPSQETAKLHSNAVVETPWWYVPEQQASSQTADQQGANLRMDALVCGVQRKLAIIQERCEATEARCNLTLAHLEDRLTKAMTNTVSEHAVMKLEIEELGKRMDVTFFPLTHKYGEVCRQLEDLDLQISQLIRFCEQKPPQHQLLDRWFSHATQSSLEQTGDCSREPPPLASVVAVPTRHSAREVHAAEMTTSTGRLVQKTVDAKLQVMLAHQLPGTDDAKNPAEELSFSSEAVDATGKDCELCQIDPDLTAPEIKSSAVLASEMLSSTKSHARRWRTSPERSHLPPSQGVVNAQRKMSPQTPRQTPRLPAAQHLAASDLEDSQEMMQEGDSCSVMLAAFCRRSARQSSRPVPRLPIQQIVQHRHSARNGFV